MKIEDMEQIQDEVIEQIAQHEEIGNTFANMAQEGNDELEDELADLLKEDQEQEAA